MTSASPISPTAHYTGYVWARNGLSHPELATREGRVMYEALRPAMTISRALGGASLEDYLLARHRAIDTLLERAIEQHGVTQVIEVAAGLSPRGWRFSERYGDRLTYVEADLPQMAQRKRRALERMGSLSDRHTVSEVDALRDGGPNSIAALAAQLHRDEGSDLHVGSVQTTQVRAFRVALSVFVRGQVHLHFDSAEQAVAALHAAGFASAGLHRAAEIATERRAGDPGARLAHILEASTR
jgi:hypothetical protein